MTRPERYDELRRQHRLAVNCTDLDKTIKRSGSVSEKGDVYIPCDRCRKDHRLSWEKLLAVRERWEQEHTAQCSEVAALRELVSEVSVIVVSDGMTELVALQVRARKLLKGSGAA